MNSKKLIYYIGILTIIFSFISCDNNDDAQTNPANPTDGFTHNNVFFETPNAYIEIDEDDNDNNNFPDSYNFFFLNARMADGDVSLGAPPEASEYIFSSGFSNFVFFNLKPDNNPSLANSGPTAGNTYNGDVYSSTNLTPDTTIVEDEVAIYEYFSPSYFINGVEYGNITGTGSNLNPNRQGPNNPTPTITVNAINIDSTNPAESTIDVDYSYVNHLGETFTGHYEGTLGVIFD